MSDTYGARFPFRSLMMLLLAFFTQASFGHETQWVKQFGTPGYDAGTGIARHSTGVYVTGYQAALPSQIQDESVTSGFLRRFDASGNLLWARDFALGSYGTQPRAVVVDDSGVYITGAADNGAFAQKYDDDGQLVWTHLFTSSDPGRWMTVGWAIAVHSTGVYVAGESNAVCDPQFECLDNGLVSRLDLSGNEVWLKIAGRPFSLPHPLDYRDDASANAIAVDASGVYVAGALGGVDVRRYDFSGQLTSTFGIGDTFGSGLALDDSGIYLAGLPCPPCQFASRVRKYNRAGNELWTRELPPEYEHVSGIAGDGKDVWVTGRVYHDFPKGPVNPFVFRYAADGTLVSTDEFGAEPGSDEGYAVAVGDGGVYVTGFTTGSFTGQVPTDHGDIFVIKRTDSASGVVRALSLGDINHDGTAELAVVGYASDVQPSADWVVIKDSATRATVRTFTIADGAPAVDATTVPDTNGNGAAEIVLLSAANHRATVHDTLSGALLKSVALDTSFAPLQVVRVPDQNGNAVAELAVLESNAAAAQVEIRDAKSGALIRIVQLASTKSLQPRDLAAISDLNQNGSVELAVLAKNIVPGKPAKVSILDSITGLLIRNVALESGSDPVKLVVVPDINGNGSDELAVMREGSMRIVVEDSKTAQVVSVLSYKSTYRPFDLQVMPDFNGSGHPKIALWAVRTSDGKVRALVSDVLTREQLGSAYFGVATTVRPDAGAVTADLDGNGVPELVRVGVRGSDGTAVAAFRDAITGTAVGGELSFRP